MIVCVLVLRTDRYGMPRALGWSLLAVVFLGPIVWPWYETWGIVFLALAVDAWSRRVVLVLSAVACFATVPAHVTAGPADIVVASAGLAVVGAAAVLWLAHTRGVAGATSDPSRAGPVRVRGPGGRRAVPARQLTRCWEWGGDRLIPTRDSDGLPEGGRIRATHP